MSYFSNLKQIQLDILKEIGNIGAGNAATSLSDFLNMSVAMSVPKVNVVSFDEMMELAGGSDETQAAVFVTFEGEINGSVYLLFSPEDADQFVKLLTADDSQSVFNEENPLAISAFKELGNILVGSYLRALSDFTNLNLYQSVPNVSIDMVGAILSEGILEISTVSDEVIMIETVLNEFGESNDSISGHFVLLPDPLTYKKIFQSLGVNNHE
ncbi:chemotaxis protein CheC [Bacillaceae bacterium W0354]